MKTSILVLLPSGISVGDKPETVDIEILFPPVGILRETLWFCVNGWFHYQ